MRGISLLPSRTRHLDRIAAGLIMTAAAVVWPSGCFAADPLSGVPDWLKAHVGYNDGQIAPVVLERARALYLRKTRAGAARNPCYFAMDATRPSKLSNGQLGRRFYIICEAKRSFEAISSGHGGGRRLLGVADFSNGKVCARNFGNAMSSSLTAGGAYVTSEQTTSFKGYYRRPGGQQTPLMRSFVQFEGEGETANAREREIGGHAAVLLRKACLSKKPDSPYADTKGFVPLGTIENYSDGRSSGCTSWSPADASRIVGMLKEKPATLYIYPESRDIEAVAKAVKTKSPLSASGAYWNASCLAAIGAPRFWAKERLEPVVARYEKAHPAPAPRPTPICAR